MKKILTPPIKENCTYYSDFTGKCFGFSEPEVVLSIQFNYGSKWDTSEVSFHLTDEEVTPILQIIKNNLTTESKKHWETYCKLPFLD